MSNLKFILLLLLAVQASAQTINITGPAGSGQFGSSVTVLTNGNYVVADPLYDEGAIVDVGAVYLYNGNSHTLIGILKGTTTGDSIGSGGILKLTNGNYVVLSPKWDNGMATNAGAATWGNGVIGISGIIDTTNSLVGSSANDHVGGNINTAQYIPNDEVIALGNGNYILLTPKWDNGPISDAGAVTFCNGLNGVSGIVSSSNSLVGSTAEDKIGEYGVSILSNSNYVVLSPWWDNGAAVNAGAATWGNGQTGTTGIVNSGNSLVGSSTDDLVGLAVTTGLINSNYLVISQGWNNGSATGAGAVTWCNGTTGLSGFVSPGNSLVGGTMNDRVGSSGVIVLTNGNYVVGSEYWDNGIATNAGAATWANGATGINGTVTSSNSLVGSSVNDQVGILKATPLKNGNFVIVCKYWDNGSATDAGAVTWGNGTTGITGEINSSNSLVGNNSYDYVGADSTNVTTRITALNNGNYVIRSANFDYGGVKNSGAVTWANGTTGITGFVMAENSLVGSKINDKIGSEIITGLTNGNYVVCSPNWDNGSITNAGAVTWGNGNSGVKGFVSASNSLVGSHSSDQLGMSSSVTILSNGNYVISSAGWDNGSLVNAGAVTWANGTTGISGVITSSNSLVGTVTNNYLGQGQGSLAVTALSNGNYVLVSKLKTPFSISFNIYVTWANGLTGLQGHVTAANSLISNNYEQPEWGHCQVIALSNSNYLVNFWDWQSYFDYGAVTWGNGTLGTTGLVSSANSLVGSTPVDHVGWASIELTNGNYIVISQQWNNGIITDAGAITWGNGSTGVQGYITNCNSITGNAFNQGSSMTWIYNYINDNLIVGRPAENIVSIYNPSGMAVASTQDSVTVTINGTSSIPLITSNGCHIIATLTPNGVSPVNGALKAKVWVEPAVPVYVDDPFVSRHYEITPAANAATATGRITLYFTQQEFDDFNNHAGSVLNLPNNDGDAIGIANLRVGKYAGSSNNNSGLPGTYAGAPSIIDPNDTDVVWNSNLNRWEISFEVTGFSGFVVQTKATALPLQLLNFSAMLVQNDAVLTWKTTGETNTQSFEVLRSTDGQSFTKVGTVTAINNPIDQTYNYSDVGAGLLKTSKLYYRLKLVDKDGSYNNSLIVMLHLSKNNHVTVYPNPVNNITVLSFSNSSLIGTIAVLTDMLGKKLQQFTISNYQQPVNMSQLTAGMYILKLKDGTTVKLIKN